MTEVLPSDIVNNNAWWEGVEVQLPREERMFLLGNLTGKGQKKVKADKSRPQRSNSTVLVNGEVDPDGEEEDTPPPVDDDREYEDTAKTLSAAQKKCI